MQTVKLGQTDTDVTRLGLGCWQFSQNQTLTGKFWDTVADDDATAIVRASLEGGINWFDTAEAYGDGRSERVLAAALKACGKKDGDVVVATKWMPLLRTASSVKKTIDERVACLSPFSIDLHQVHQPVALSSVEKQMDAMADVLEAGKIRHVGVSNFSARAMERCHRALDKRGLKLVSNQVRYHLLAREIEDNGVLQVAKDIGATIIAYSPLGQGILTGRFHDDPESLKRTRLFRRAALRWHGLSRSRPLIDELKAVAEQTDHTPAQVALSWTTRFHGDVVVAIPGASRPSQAESNVAALSLELSAEQRARIDAASRACSS